MEGRPVNEVVRVDLAEDVPLGIAAVNKLDVGRVVHQAGGPVAANDNDLQTLNEEFGIWVPKGVLET